MSEGIGAYGVVIFTDEGAFGIVDSFRNTNHNVAVFLKCTAYLRKEFLCVKSCLRQINKKRIVTCIFAGKGTCGGQPACVTSHDLHDGYGFFLIDAGIQGDLADCGSHISGRTSKSRRMIGMHKVIVNGFRFADNADVTADHGCIAGKLAHRIHGVISANIKEPANIHLFKPAEQFRVYRVLQRLGKLIAAGAKISTWGVSEVFQLFPGKSFLKIQDCAFQKSLNSIYHSINMSDFLLTDSLRNHTIKTAVYHCGRSAGLSDDQILFCHTSKSSCCSWSLHYNRKAGWWLESV